MSEALPRRAARAPDAQRRRGLRTAAALMLGFSVRPLSGWAADSGAPRRVVVLNWELTETLLALGVAPVGIPLPDWYRNTVAVPPLPRGVADVGLLYQPNFDVLLALKPDLLIVTPGHASLQTPLQRIAPTLTLGAYMSAPRPYAGLCDETATMARALGVPARATALIASTNNAIADTAASLHSRSGHLADSAPPRSVIVADVVDERHVRVYAAGSLFDEVLGRLGVINAANPPGAPMARWAANAMGTATVPLQRLLDVSHADLLLVGPLDPAVRVSLTASPLWRALPAARSRRVAVLPVIAPYGGLVSMQRFAEGAVAALAAIDAGGDGLG
ncbi:iron complex transport system substrate-binding protein [Paraburkholderia eburnea]|uniref:Iron complex transport system substrate-binding protein n=1 Tax=Paraburkholderia eburnea TaxID=1189126 RepID=A0A2S4LV41_9BURK|nr:ABC transporter substrate-binding protein [Paraburkholderia eburnea]POR46308.1 iron complex transport system substrate-binding protein [Paraburkholderia eburnea]PRZ16261.1 iron complex transport system substrate-binding protein [Paraburkholderia eburnea]